MRLLGNVADLAFDPDGTVRSLVVTPARGIVRRERALPITALQRADSDGVTIANESFVRHEKTEFSGVLMRGGEASLCGMSLVTEDGKELGIIADVVLDGVMIQTGGAVRGEALRLWGFEVSDGLVKDLLDGRPVVEAAGAYLEGERVVLGGDPSHMKLGPVGHATSVKGVSGPP